MERNFIPSASSINPSTTLTEFSQPPDFGSLSKSDGTNAKIVNGIAKAIENASIATTGAQISPCVLLIKMLPTMGPVQEKETSTALGNCSLLCSSFIAFD